MKPTDDLVAEHEGVLLALKILEKVEPTLGIRTSPAVDDLAQLLEFFKGFVDRCHHGKEELVLFPELERRGVAREGGPIGIMLSEHEAGRERVREMAAGLERLRNGEPGAADAIRGSASAYRVLLRMHIEKENTTLFPMADRLLPADVAARVVEGFEEIERDRVGPGKHEAYHAMLHTLRTRYGVS